MPTVDLIDETFIKKKVPKIASDLSFKTKLNRLEKIGEEVDPTQVNTQVKQHENKLR
jgi:hypothetical protein